MCAVGRRLGIPARELAFHSSFAKRRNQAVKSSRQIGQRLSQLRARRDLDAQEMPLLSALCVACDGWKHAGPPQMTTLPSALVAKKHVIAASITATFSSCC